MPPDLAALVAALLAVVAAHALKRARLLAVGGNTAVALGVAGAGLAVLLHGLGAVWPAAVWLAGAVHAAAVVATASWLAGALGPGLRATAVIGGVAIATTAVLVWGPEGALGRHLVGGTLLAAGLAAAARMLHAAGLRALPMASGVGLLAVFAALDLVLEPAALGGMLVAAAAVWLAVASTWAWLRRTGEPHRDLILPALLLSGILAAGLATSQGLAGWREGELRSDLHERTAVLAATLEPADLARHDCTRESTEREWFIRTKERLRAARAADPDLRYVYLLTARDGKIYFPNDDVRRGEPDYTEPDDVYSECPPEMQVEVEAGRPFLVGPYSDRWGEFISVGVPVRHPDGRGCTLVATDVAAAGWRGEIGLWRLSGGIVTALAALLALVMVGRGRALRRAEAAAREAEEANRAKDAYLAAVSHELRTPLNGIIGMTNLLAEGELDRQQREFVELAHLSARQLLGLTNELLDFARIEAGRMELASEPFRLRELVDDALALVGEQALAKGLELAAIVDPAVPDALLGDSARLRQILLNLLGNGVKFTESGEVVARITAGDDPDPARLRLRLEVSDSGIGIPAEVQGRLFRPFMQADSAIGRRYGGTGLGLCIARRLCEAMEGRIGLASILGQGTTVTAELRLGRAGGSPGPLPAVIPDQHRGGEVLVAVAHPALREALTAQLAFLGMRARIAGEPAGASSDGICAALVEPAWAPGLSETLTAARIPTALIATANAGGTQLVARRRTPVIGRPVRLITLVRALRQLWGEAGTTVVRRSDALIPAQGGPPQPPAPRPPEPVAAQDEAEPQSLPASAPPVPAAAMVNPHQEMALAFSHGLPTAVEQIAGAVAAGDLARAREVARPLRHGAAALGLAELGELCRQLELASGREQAAEVRRIAALLPEARGRAERALAERQSPARR